MNRFTQAITLENAAGRVAVIPDIKCRSPKAGDLTRRRDSVAAAQAFVAAGAPLLSVVTEPEHFGGSPDLLRAVVEATGVPVLRKDFITTRAEVRRTADLGAEAVLLIAALMDDVTLARLAEEAAACGLTPLVEVATAAELDRAVGLEARLIGINNRDITALERDDGGPERTAALAGGVPLGTLLVSESGIDSPAAAASAVAAGADAILVGTALWQAPDLATAYGAFRVAWEDRCRRS